MLEERWGLKLDEYKALVMVGFINDKVSSIQSGLTSFKRFGVFDNSEMLKKIYMIMAKTHLYLFFFFNYTWTGINNTSQKH